MDTNVIERLTDGIFSKHDLERRHGWPAALVIAAEKKGEAR